MNRIKTVTFSKYLFHQESVTITIPVINQTNECSFLHIFKFLFLFFLHFPIILSFFASIFLQALFLCSSFFSFLIPLSGFSSLPLFFFFFIISRFCSYLFPAFLCFLAFFCFYPALCSSFVYFLCPSLLPIPKWCHTDSGV